VIHGAPVSTFDLDIVPERSDDNVARLLRALASVDAVHRDLAGRSIAPDASRLRGPGHNLFMTRSGPLDVLGTIGRGRDFSALASRSRPIDLGDASDSRANPGGATEAAGIEPESVIKRKERWRTTFAARARFFAESVAVMIRFSIISPSDVMMQIWL